jgi:Cu+-exporting ATPase
MPPTKEGEKMETVHDPVCGMDIAPADAAGTEEYNGQTYFFCSRGCQQAFNDEPEKYTD